jgi:hypothetical protein
MRLDDVLPLAGGYELVVLHTSAPSFASDVKVAEAPNDANPKLKVTSECSWRSNRKRCFCS